MEKRTLPLSLKKTDKAIIVSVFGIRGSGKSILTAKIADILSQGGRIVVFDVADEWGGKFVTSYKAFCVMKKLHPEKKVFVVKFSLEQSQEEMIEIVSEITKELYNEATPTTLVFEEAQFFYPLHGTHPILQRLVMVGRHRNLSIVANTQRPAQIYKGLLSQSEFVYCGKLFEKNDIQYLSGTIGKTNAETLPTLPDHVFLEFQAGNTQKEQVLVKI